MGKINIDTVEGRQSLQRALNHACWYVEQYHILVTGEIDDETVRSIVEFQRIFDLPQTGTIDDAQMAMLEDEMVRKNITDY